MFKLDSESQKLVNLNGMIENRVRNSEAQWHVLNLKTQLMPRAASLIPGPGLAGPGRLGLLPPVQPESQQPVTRFKFRAAYHSHWQWAILYV